MKIIIFILGILFILFLLAVIFVDASDEGIRKSEEKIEKILEKYTEWEDK